MRCVETSFLEKAMIYQGGSVSMSKPLLLDIANLIFPALCRVSLRLLPAGEFDLRAKKQIQLPDGRIEFLWIITTIDIVACDQRRRRRKGCDHILLKKMIIKRRENENDCCVSIASRRDFYCDCSVASRRWMNHHRRRERMPLHP